VTIFLLEIVCFISALGLEVVSMLMIVENHSPGSDLLTPFFSHLTASIASAILLPKFLSSSENQADNTINLLFFFIIAFYIPILGMLGLAFAVVPGLRPIKADSKLLINFNRIREFSNVPTDRSLHFEYGAVSLENLLRSQSPDKRMTAVYATLKLDDKNAIPLLRTALRDPVDDIRLLAYALIDRKEQRISERIEQARQSLENNEATNTRHLYKCIVKDYWELAHLGLVEGETLNYVLNKTREYLENALKLYPKDRGLHLQYAKLLLRLKNPQDAYNEFKLAEALGIGKKQLLLYYAEIDFLQRRYGEVKRYMKEIDLVTAHPQIHAAKRFWQES
jgi:polysaccharide biosynthesis protein PelE